MTEVVAALICQDHRFLICQRPSHKARGLLWEFVGGKRENGESKEEALIRECREELGVMVEVGEVYMELSHVYPDITIELTLYKAKIIQGTPQLLEHNDLRWIQVAQIPRFNFCPADEEILERLMEQGL
ncbi:(deoxy)nucleoside triphosphate pyrophosphohydrolase [Anaerotignum sp. MB30-C6]|uniref:(deoxy)nucleoside triphosphate pyrophosphohydrolase n=1 Tax=Anaerotignum sp. MB30-C6 TaxID=3070814 RepID=UPI0027DE6E93|nr:(deoxy)nucleoside triphosphate pyrophosphohydrolase [Anaerotignum sp. MB30-C6]WMI82171.1 (deoxy)nucleoside triphosphate pyrophosphohydrolase [Anaerotignum sp. MB30-C6]